jgi:glycosylphosphatidylinositol transamidase (GPIT) subunit GPI8
LSNFQKGKKKDKEKTTKNVSKVEKHKSDNIKRMESFQQRRQENQSQKTAISEALAAVVCNEVLLLRSHVRKSVMCINPKIFRS